MRKNLALYLVALKPLGQIIILVFVLLFWDGFWPKLAPRPLEMGQARQRLQNAPETSPANQLENHFVAHSRSKQKLKYKMGPCKVSVTDSECNSVRVPTKCTTGTGRLVARCLHRQHAVAGGDSRRHPRDDDLVPRPRVVRDEELVKGIPKWLFGQVFLGKPGAPRPHNHTCSEK